MKPEVSSISFALLLQKRPALRALSSAPLSLSHSLTHSPPPPSRDVGGARAGPPAWLGALQQVREEQKQGWPRGGCARARAQQRPAWPRGDRRGRRAACREIRARACVRAPGNGHIAPARVFPRGKEPPRARERAGRGQGGRGRGKGRATHARGGAIGASEVRGERHTPREAHLAHPGVRISYLVESSDAVLLQTLEALNEQLAAAGDSTLVVVEVRAACRGWEIEQRGGLLATSKGFARQIFLLRREKSWPGEPACMLHRALRAPCV